MKKQIYSGTDEFYHPQDFTEFMESKKFQEVYPDDEILSARNVFYNDYLNVSVVNMWNTITSTSLTNQGNNIYSTVTLLGRKKDLSKVEKMILEEAEKFKEE